MYVVTIQKTKYVKGILSGEYIPSFWESHYSCLSPRFSTVYRDISDRLSQHVSCDKDLVDIDYDLESCFYGWVLSNGALGIDWSFYENWSESLKSKYTAMVIDIPEDCLVLADFTELCEYLYGDSNNLSHCYLNEYFLEGKYVQASWKAGSNFELVGMFGLDEFKKRFS